MAFQMEDKKLLELELIANQNTSIIYLTDKLNGTWKNLSVAWQNVIKNPVKHQRETQNRTASLHTTY